MSTVMMIEGLSLDYGVFAHWKNPCSAVHEEVFRGLAG